jgi:hypothetical protein
MNLTIRLHAANNNFCNKYVKQRTLERLCRRWEDNINMDLQEVGSGAWTRSTWLRIGTVGWHV